MASLDKYEYIFMYLFLYIVIKHFCKHHECAKYNVISAKFEPHRNTSKIIIIHSNE